MGAALSGDEALSIKSGNRTINGGTFTGTGPFFDPAESNNDGTEPTGAAVSITTNHAYEKNVSMVITGGILIKDTANGNNLLYCGVNLTTTGNTPAVSAK